MDTFRKCLEKVRRSLPGIEVYVRRTPVIHPVCYDKAFRTWRYNFCKEFVVRMPREVRDMVYGYSLEPEYSIIVRYSRHDSGGSFRSLKDAARVSPSLGKDGDFSLSRWMVGADFALELASLFYTRATFDIIDPRDLEDVLENDIFDVGIKPCHLIRSLRVHVWGDLQRGRWLNRQNDNLTLQDLLLERLKDLQCRSVLAVEVRLHFSTINTCKQSLRNIAPLLYDMLAEGVDVQVSRQRGGEIGQWAEIASRRVYDLSSLFEGTLEECIKKIQRAGRFARLGVENGEVVYSSTFVRRRIPAGLAHR